MKSPLFGLLLLFGLCAVLLYIVPNDPCDDDTYALDRDLFTPEVRARCESPGQAAVPTVMIRH